MNFIDLPPEIIQIIATKLPVRNVYLLKQTCTEINYILTGEKFWREMCKKHWGCQKKPKRYNNWGEIYKIYFISLENLNFLYSYTNISNTNFSFTKFLKHFYKIHTLYHPKIHFSHFIVSLNKIKKNIQNHPQSLQGEIQLTKKIIHCHFYSLYNKNKWILKNKDFAENIINALLQMKHTAGHQSYGNLYEKYYEKFEKHYRKII